MLEWPLHRGTFELRREHACRPLCLHPRRPDAREGAPARASRHRADLQVTVGSVCSSRARARWWHHRDTQGHGASREVSLRAERAKRAHAVHGTQHDARAAARGPAACAASPARLWLVQFLCFSCSAAARRVRSWSRHSVLLSPVHYGVTQCPARRWIGAAVLCG